MHSTEMKPFWQFLFLTGNVACVSTTLSLAFLLAWCILEASHVRNNQATLCFFSAL